MKNDFGQMVFSTDFGNVCLTFPWKMTDQDVADAIAICTSQLSQIPKARRILEAREAEYQKLKGFAP